MLPARLELLQNMPIFGAVREDALQVLLEQPRSVRIAAGSYFFHEREAANGMYVLESGRAMVLKEWQGRELPLRELGPGDCFGEMALVDLYPRSAAVRAVTVCQAIGFGPEDLLRLYERDCEQFALIQMNIGREMCRRLRITDEMLFQARMGDMTAAATSGFQAL
jgi:CRP-like cAMP-binding protein